MSTDTLNPSSLSSKNAAAPRAANEGGYHVGAKTTRPTSWIEWFAQNIRQVAIAGVSLMLAAGGFSFYQNKQEAKASQARDAQYLAVKTLKEKLTGLEKPATPPVTDVKKKGTAAPATPAPVLASLKDFAAEREAVLKVAQTYPGTRAAYESLLLVADLEFDRGDAAAAVTHYEGAVREARTPFDRDQAKLSLGFAQESAGKKAEAVVTWTQVSDSALEVTLTAEALVSAARVQIGLGKKAEAQKALERALTVAPGTEVAGRAERLKAAL